MSFLGPEALKEMKLRRRHRWPKTSLRDERMRQEHAHRTPAHVSGRRGASGRR